MKKKDKKIKSTTDVERILTDLVIDENGPGTILRDFETMLDFVAEQKPVIGSKNKMLTGKTPIELNSRLTEPLQVDLKRPIQKSFPNVNGLYLLLRTTRVAKIDLENNKYRIVPNEDVLKSWRSLNPVEKYFTLLEAWWFRGSLEIIGESDTGRYNGPLFRWKKFDEYTSGKDIVTIQNDADFSGYLRYLPGRLFLSLLNLFGFIDLEYGDPEPGKGCNLLSIRKNSLGKAFLIFLTDGRFVSPEKGFHIIFPSRIDDENEPFGKLQNRFSPYFKDWKNNLVSPEQEIKEGVFVLNVSLGRAKRTFAFPGDLTFDFLAETILNHFDFDFDHLYKFIYENDIGKRSFINHPYMEDPPLADETPIKEVFRTPGQIVLFLYDFGDNWEFIVKLEEIGDIDPDLKKPKLLQKTGKAPDQYPDWDDDDFDDD